MSKHAILRWQVTIWYCTDAGSLDVQHAVEELSEVEKLIEAGPDWNTVERIEIELARKLEPGLTLEEADRR